MRARHSDRFAIDDQPTVHRWARRLTVVYSLSLVALVAFALVSHQLANPRTQTADGLRAGASQTVR